MVHIFYADRYEHYESYIPLRRNLKKDFIYTFLKTQKINYDIKQNRYPAHKNRKFVIIHNTRAHI